MLNNKCLVLPALAGLPLVLSLAAIPVFAQETSRTTEISAMTSSSDAKTQTAATQLYYPADQHQHFSGPETVFTGKVEVELLFPPNETAHFSGAYVTFDAGARTAWHSHPAGQHMIVMKGTALTGTRDGNVIEFQKGETVWCPKDIDHWHGATSHAPMTHLVLTGDDNGANVTWKEKVTDEVYLAAQTHAPKTLTDSSLSLAQQYLVPVSAFTANGNLTALKAAITNALEAGVEINTIKEAQIQLYAYAGFPRALNGLGTLMTVVEQRKAAGKQDKLGAEATGLTADADKIKVGTEVQTTLVGRPVQGPLFDFAPAINSLLQGHLFGELFGRGILTYQDREVVTIAALAAMDGVESQLKSHVGIGANVGLTQQQLSDVARLLGDSLGPVHQADLSRLIDAQF